MDTSIHSLNAHLAAGTQPRSGPSGRHRFWPAVLALLVALLGLIAVAAAAERDAAETLAIGDKVTISVFGQTDLSGDFVLDGTGAVNMPLAGRIRIAGLTAPEAEARIRSALMDGYLRDAVVSLRVAELKPVYIMGEVRSPGTYPFRHGLNVLGAVALAGGYRVGDESLSLLKSELLLADEREHLLNASLQTLIARRLRLEAERDGVKQLVADARTAASAQILAGEQEILDFQRRAREGERELLSQQISRLGSERTALTEQAELAERQVELTREQSTEYNKLATTGHGLRTVQVEREREHARARSDAARIRAELAKNETALGELTLRLRELDNTYMRRVVLELQETRQKILEVERSVPVAREIAESRRRRLVASEGSGVAADWDIRITRQAGLTPVTIQAKFETPLQPGDIVQLSPRARPIEGQLPGEAQTPLRKLTGLASQQ
ncbi:polysaccharide biosynthesis/export family protein [Bosea sp. CS1GBMeth4]|uniref:polysaccharide biosynthesis/export family protein n=1 Tax=Bosea sp. CS1GBMeth4 TaxID=1892849 RepID=UPI001649708C|nr:polysaccharide biosynthesis/export family protein [Bosea sp. CS1GBMeth4]